jgi:hypothetical protein
MAASREARLAAENKDLVDKLAGTHQKLQQLRAKGQQRDAIQQAQVGVDGQTHARLAGLACMLLHVNGFHVAQALLA